MTVIQMRPAAVTVPLKRAPSNEVEAAKWLIMPARYQAPRLRRRSAAGWKASRE